MIEALIGFLLGVAGTYLAMTRARAEEEDFRNMLRDLKR